MDMQIDDVTLEEAIDTAMDFQEKGQPCRIVTPNAEFAIKAAKDSHLLQVINESQLILPDGISVILAAKIIGTPLKGKVAGALFADALAAKLACEGKSLYILGAAEGVAQKAAQKLQEKHPGLIIAGTQNGYFTDEEAVVNEIEQARPNCIFVALGCPKQEFFMEKHGHRFGPAVMIGVGGAVDVFAGNLNWAPAIFVKLGLEWLYRLIKQPSRIKRMIKLPKYLWWAFKYRIKNGKNKEVNHGKG